GSVTCLVIIVLEVIVSLFMNGFIVLVIFCNWLKGEITASVNKILVALSISNMCFAAMSLISVLVTVFWRQIQQTDYTNFAFLWVTMLCLTSCSWLTACLCFFFFIKIVNFSSGWLAGLKTRIDSSVHWLILVAEVVVFCSVFIQVLIHVVSLELERIKSVNSSFDASQKASLSYLNSHVDFMANCVSLLIIFGTTLSTICFLKLHSHRMKRKLGTSSTAPLKTHRRPVIMMISFLLFYAVYYVELFSLSFVHFSRFSIEFWLLLISMFSFTPCQSIILIWFSPKLREAFKTFLYSFIYRNTKYEDSL
uniref:Taste receptor type 2 n=1 Tax=Leptobrachium leishanense TaxID=445787 RepID=A0A8C5PPY6_9ANUR